MDYKNSKDILQLEASSQWGMFTAARAQELGVSRLQINRMSKNGQIEPMTYGVYRYTAGDETQFPEIKAAWLSCFPKLTAWDRIKNLTSDAIVAGRTATVLHGAGDFYASPYTFIVSGSKRSSRKNLKLYPWDIQGSDIVFIEGLPVTSFERTIADLIRLNEDRSLLDNFIQQMLSKGASINTEDLSRLLAPLAKRNGFAANDGDSFAQKIAERNITQSQIDAKLDELNQILRPLSHKTAEINISELLNSSPSLKDLRGTLFKALKGTDDYFISLGANESQTDDQT